MSGVGVGEVDVIVVRRRASERDSGAALLAAARCTLTRPRRALHHKAGDADGKVDVASSMGIQDG